MTDTPAQAEASVEATAKTEEVKAETLLSKVENAVETDWHDLQAAFEHLKERFESHPSTPPLLVASSAVPAAEKGDESVGAVASTPPAPAA